VKVISPVSGSIVAGTLEGLILASGVGLTYEKPVSY